MSAKVLDDALCKVQQAQQVLSVWMESDCGDKNTNNMIGALMSVLDGVPETISNYCYGEEETE